MNRLLRTVLALLCLSFALPAAAWGPTGHQTVATLAAGLIKGSPTEARVQALLGPFTLAQVAVWADCAKGIDPKQNYAYTGAGKYPECKTFETPALEAEMSDFVRRNDQSCQPRPGEEICHKQYHYSDIAIQRDHYEAGAAGTRNDDIVAVVRAAAQVLHGDHPDAPISIKDPREALFLLVHYVGDLHQPLHVGAIYLDGHAKPLDPGAGPIDPATDTRGGNNIQVGSAKLHALWDAVPSTLAPAKVGPAWLARAGKVPPTPGPFTEWSTTWGSGTLVQAQAAFNGLTFAGSHPHWSGTLPAKYTTTSNAIKTTQLTAGGAHLAELLKAVLP